MPQNQNPFFIMRPTDEVSEKIKQLCKQTGLSKTAVVSRAILGAAIREMPPMDYHKLIAEVRAAGHNLNQLARVANASGHIDKKAYQESAAEVQRVLTEIQLAFFRR